MREYTTPPPVLDDMTGETISHFISKCDPRDRVDVMLTIICEHIEVLRTWMHIKDPERGEGMTYPVTKNALAAWLREIADEIETDADVFLDDCHPSIPEDALFVWEPGPFLTETS
jgi:hypothetical protein